MWGPGFPGNNPPFAECSAVSTQMQDQGAGTTVLRNILEVRNCQEWPAGQPGAQTYKTSPQTKGFCFRSGFSLLFQNL